MLGGRQGAQSAACAASAEHASPHARCAAPRALNPHHVVATIRTCRQLVDALLVYNLRFSLEPSPEEAEEERQQAEAEGGEQQAAGVRGAQAEPPLRFRPAVHVPCTFPVGAVASRSWPGP